MKSCMLCKFFCCSILGNCKKAFLLLDDSGKSVFIVIKTGIFSTVCWGIWGAGHRLKFVVVFLLFYFKLFIWSLQFLSAFHSLLGQIRLIVAPWVLVTWGFWESTRRITHAESREHSFGLCLISNLWLPPAGTARVLHSISSPSSRFRSNENSPAVTACESCTEITSVHLAGAFQALLGRNWFPYFGPFAFGVCPKDRFRKANSALTRSVSDNYLKMLENVRE